MKQTTAQSLDGEFQLVHAVPGRVRLRSTDNRAISTLEKVAKQLRQQDGICEVQTNPVTNSLVITFDENVVSLPQTLERLQTSAKLSEASAKSQPSPELTLDSLLRELPAVSSQQVAKSIIPLVAGALVTGALGVEGIVAFPIYSITASVTRHVIKQFESKPLTEEQRIEGVEEQQIHSHLTSSIQNPHSKIQNQEEVAYQVVHEIPGRIRFRVPRLASDPEYAQRLTVLAQADTKLTDVRVNATAASIAISYEIGLLSDDKMRLHLIDLIQTASDANILIDLKGASQEQDSQEESPPWSGLALPVVSATLALLGGPFGLPIPPIVIGGAIAISAIPVAQRAFDSILTDKCLNIDFLDLAAITITTLQGHFISPSIMIVLVEVGEAIREQTAKSSKLQTLDLLDSLEQFVWVERNGEKEQISIHNVQQGDIVIVYPGSQIPVDGRIIRGKALIDEQKLTGEAMPVMRKQGQAVYTSTLVREGQLYILTEKVGADTRAGQIIKVMQDAPVHDTRIENYAANIANQAVVPTLLLSGVVFAFTGNFARAASVLTLDFATGIRVAVPTTVLAALTYAARRGILIRSGRALEKLAQVNAVVFDKTGTLTQGEPTVVRVETASESISPLQVITLAAAAEQRLTHPVAAAIVHYAQEQGAEILPRGKWDYQIGLGVKAEINGQSVLVGSDRFLRQEGINLDSFQEKHLPLVQAGCNSIIYVASDGQLLGLIAYRDPLRRESRAVIKALRAEGMEIHLLTGDKKQTAHAVAQELGIEKTYTHAEAFPEEKVAVVKDLHEQGQTVAFVGDGINDSPALAYADVSVSFANGSEVARETADVVLMENNLRGLPEAIAIAQQAMQLIHQNTGIIAVPNLGALVLAVAVGIDPLSATLVNNGTTVIAGINGLRPLIADSEELQQLAVSLDTDSQEQDSDRILTLEGAEHGNNHQSTREIPLTLQQSLETSSEYPMSAMNGSFNGNGNGANHHHTMNGSRKAKGERLTAVALANRLKVSATTISRRKSKPDFSEWARNHDPDGMTWAYSQKSKLFMAG
jgi:P-type Cu2+ transporter